MILNFSTTMSFDAERPTGFIDKVAQGQKTTTIRAGFRWNAGDKASVYTGSRTKYAVKHFDLKVMAVSDKLILFDEVLLNDLDKVELIPNDEKIIVYHNGFDITEHLKVLAYWDGFERLEDFKRWFYLATGNGKKALIGQSLHFSNPYELTLKQSPYLCFEHIESVRGIIRDARAIYGGSKSDKKRFESDDYLKGVRERILAERRRLREMNGQ